MKVNKAQRTMASRYKVNFFDKCSDADLDHSDRCYGLHGKTSSLVQLVSDGGLFDLYSQFGFRHAKTRPSKMLKIGWIGEPRGIAHRIDKLYASLEQQARAGTLFDKEGFDYIYTHDQSLLELDPRFRFLVGNGTQIKFPRLHNKTKMTSMITSNKNQTEGHQLRNRLAAKWSDSVDLYGSGYNYIRVKEQGLVDYRFSVAVENVKLRTWITEKVLDCFATGTVPLYWGTPEITEYFNADGIIFIDEDFDINSLTEQDYVRRLPAIQDNFMRVLDILHPLDYIVSNHVPDCEYLVKDRKF